MSVDLWLVFISIIHSVSGSRQSKKFKMNSGKTKRTRFAIAKKIEILDLVKSGTIPRTEICKNYKIASSTLHTFLKFERKIRKEFDLNKRHNKADDPQLSLP